MYQLLIAIGRLTRDPEMRYMPNGTAVTTFSLACDRVYNDKDGNRQKEVTYYRVSVFGKQAENANQYLKKGDMTLVEGLLSPDPKTGGPKTFTRQDGTVSASYEIRADSVRFFPRGGQAGEGGSPSSPAADKPAGNHDDNEDTYNSIPF